MFGLEAIWRDGEVVGHIRRADFGFAIDKTIAYGYIRDPAGGPVSMALPRPSLRPGAGRDAQHPSWKPYAQACCWQLGCETLHPRVPPPCTVGVAQDAVRSDAAAQLLHCPRWWHPDCHAAWPCHCYPPPALSQMLIASKYLIEVVN